MSRVPQVSVIGSATGDDGLIEHAERVGRLLAKAGVALVCGGTTGVMEAASRGARAEGGVVIGVLMGSEASDANEYVTYTVATGIGQARNLAVVGSGDAVIAIGGEWGTLSEIAFARKLGKRVIAIDSWTLRNRTGSDLGIEEADTPEAAVESALQGLVDG